MKLDAFNLIPGLVIEEEFGNMAIVELWRDANSEKVYGQGIALDMEVSIAFMHGYCERITVQGTSVQIHEGSSVQDILEDDNFGRPDKAPLIDEI